jgi:hypothetical protein
VLKEGVSANKMSGDILKQPTMPLTQNYANSAAWIKLIVILKGFLSRLAL